MSTTDTDWLYFEDFYVGWEMTLGPRVMGEDEIRAFATNYDPQTFHVDPEEAKHSIFGGLVASGWHTASVCMRLMVDGYLKRSASLASPGVDKIRWLRPVRPGDSITLKMVVTDVVPSQSRPDRGLVRSTWEGRNQNGDIVITIEGMGLFGRRPAAAPAEPTQQP